MGIPIIESNVNIFDVLDCEYSPDEIQKIKNWSEDLWQIKL